MKNNILAIALLIPAFCILPQHLYAEQNRLTVYFFGPRTCGEYLEIVTAGLAFFLAFA